MKKSFGIHCQPICLCVRVRHGGKAGRRRFEVDKNFPTLPGRRMMSRRSSFDLSYPQLLLGGGLGCLRQTIDGNGSPIGSKFTLSLSLSLSLCSLD